MYDEEDVPIHSQVTSDEDPVIFVCNGEVNTNCLNDLSEGSCLKRGGLHTFFLRKEEREGSYDSFGLVQKKGNRTDLNCLDGNGRDDVFDERDRTVSESKEQVNNTWQILYDFKFPVDTALTDYAEPLFMMTQQSINYIATNADQNKNTLGQLNTSENKELLKRRQIKTFFNFVNQQVVKSGCNNYNNNNNFLSSSVANSLSSCSIGQDDSNEYDALFLNDLFVNVQSILLSVGLLSDYLPTQHQHHPAQQSGGNNRCLGNTTISINSRHYHLFHLHLDIYWSVLEFFFLVMMDQQQQQHPKLDVNRISEKLVKGLDCLSSSWSSFSPGLPHQQPSPDQIEQDVFQFLVELYIRDMTSLAWKRFSTLSCNDYNKVSPFSCTCVKEMWIMLIQVLRYRQRNRRGRSFWFTIYQVMSNVADCALPENPQDGSTLNLKISFRFWMVFSLAPLYQFNDTGKISTDIKYFDANYDEIIGLIKKFISSNNSVHEEELRYYLQGCLQVCQLWKPDLTLVNVLWNYFFRKLNSSFKVSSLSVTGLQTLRRSSNGLFEDCCNWQSENPSPLSLSKESSFHLFLRLVCSLLRETARNKNSSSWRNFRGRLLSKFHQRGMQELTESGLTYFTELFLTLALCTCDNQLLEQLCDFYNMIDFSLTDIQRQSVILRGISAAMLVCAKWDTTIESLSERIAPLISFVTRKFVSLETETNKKQKIWGLLAAYIEDLQDLFEHSQSLNLCEYKLITKDFSLILPVSRNYEMCRVLSMFNTLLSKLLTLIKTQKANEGDMYIPNDNHEQMTQALWVNIFPFIETHAKTPTALPEVADLATQFFMLSISLPDWSPASEIVLLKFTCDVFVNVQVTIRFLGHVLDDPIAKKSIFEESSQKMFKDSVQLKLIQCWIRCWLLIGSTPAFLESLHLVTRHVIRFPSIEKILKTTDHEVDVSDAMLQLFKKFGQLHNEAKDWKTKIDLHEEAKLYFGDVNRCIQLILKSPSDSEQLFHVYNVVGHLVKNCASLLSNAPCLPEIIDSLVFPHSLFVPTKPLNKLVLSNFQKTFHLYVSGLSQINSKQNPYVQRRLRDLVLQYLPRFPLGQSVPQEIDLSLSLNRIHPLVNVLTDLSLRNTIHDFNGFRHFVLVTIKDNLFKVEKLRLSETSSLVLGFVAKLIERTLDTEDLCLDAALLLQPLLEGYLLFKTSQTKQCAFASLSKVLKACSQHPAKSPKKTLLDILRDFQQYYFPFFNVNVFSICEKLMGFYPLLLSENAVTLMRIYKEFERKSGTGVDTNLKQQWSNYINKLGQTEEELQVALEKST